MDPNPKFLIIRFSSIGDIILTTPLVRCLRSAYPGCQIDFLVKKEFAVLLTQNPNLSTIISFDKKAGKGELIKIRSLIKNNKYTHILDIQRNIRSIYVSAGAGAKVTGFSKKLIARVLLIRFGINIYKEIKPVYLRYFEAATALGIAYDGKGTEVFTSATEEQKLTELFAQNGITSGTKILAVAPGAHCENKRWTPE